MAAAISFYSFLSLFPLLIALIAISSFFIADPDIQSDLIEAIQRLVPVLRQSSSEGQDQFLTEFFRSLQSGRVFTSSLAIIGLLWASTAVFGAVRKSVNAIWGIRKTRPFLMERFMDFSLSFGTMLLLLSSVALSTILSLFAALSQTIFPDAPIAEPRLWQQVAQVLPPLLTFFVFLILYWWLPNIKLPFKNVWPTTFAATVAFEISKQIFILYLQNLGGIGRNLYGGVSAVIVLLAFVYVSAIIMLVGAQLTARYTAYLELKSQRVLNDTLSRNLERIRSRPSLPGMPATPPAGAADSSTDTPYT